jgi:hypothetical protein
MMATWASSKSRVSVRSLRQTAMSPASFRAQTVEVLVYMYTISGSGLQGIIQGVYPQDMRAGIHVLYMHFFLVSIALHPCNP